MTTEEQDQPQYAREGEPVDYLEPLGDAPGIVIPASAEVLHIVCNSAAHKAGVSIAIVVRLPTGAIQLHPAARHGLTTTLVGSSGTRLRQQSEGDDRMRLLARRGDRTAQDRDGGYLHEQMRCNRCGVSVSAKGTTLEPIVNKLFDAHLETIDLSRLGAIVSGS